MSAITKRTYRIIHSKIRLITDLPWRTNGTCRIALTSLEAEPVAYIIQDSDARSRGERHPSLFRKYQRRGYKQESTVTPLYAAPPETVSVPDAMEMDDDFDSGLNTEKAVGWNAYRAAMFQSEAFGKTRIRNQ